MKTANIKTTVQTNPVGIREAVHYEWDGESPYAYVSLDHLWMDSVQKIRKEEEIQIGPYRLLKVDDGYFRGDFNLYVRKDKFGALRVALYKSTRLFDLIYRRLIITLAVWKLADYSPARVPSWRDIHLFKRWL